MTREDLQRMARHLAPQLDVTLQKDLGERTGFLLFLFDFTRTSREGNVAYISNAQREDMIALLDEIKGNLEAGLETDPPGARPVS
jgi:hypothetical protein